MNRHIASKVVTGLSIAVLLLLIPISSMPVAWANHSGARLRPVQGGTSIEVWSTDLFFTKSCTLGFGGWRQGVANPGMITAGHCSIFYGQPQTGNSVYQPWWDPFTDNYVGGVTLNPSGARQSDSLWAAPASGVGISDTIYPNVRIVGTVSLTEILPGQSVCKYGRVTHETCATVARTETRYNPDYGIWLSDQFIVPFSPIPQVGDSGSPVYKPSIDDGTYGSCRPWTKIGGVLWGYIEGSGEAIFSSYFQVAGDLSLTGVVRCV